MTRNGVHFRALPPDAVQSDIPKLYLCREVGGVQFIGDQSNVTRSMARAACGVYALSVM